MRTPLHILVCLFVAVLVIYAAHLLDLWVFAGATRSAASMMDTTSAWATALSRVVLALLLLILSGIVLYRPPSPFLAIIYLLGGLIPALALPLALSGVPFLLSLPLPFLAGTSSTNLYFAFAFVGALGLAAFVRRYLLPWPETPNHALQRTEAGVDAFSDLDA